MTNKDGRFDAQRAIPGLKYTVAASAPAKVFGRSQMMTLGTLFENVHCRMGPTKDLGDLKITSGELKKPPEAKNPRHHQPTLPRSEPCRSSPSPSGRGPG